MMRPTCLIVAATCLACAVGCAADSATNRDDIASINPPRNAHDDQAESVIPVALVNDVPITWSEVRRLVAETSGPMIVREIALDRLLYERLRHRGISVTTTDFELERQLLLASLDSDPDQAARLLRALRQRRSLGPRRFQRLLERNAMLRALIRDDVVITDTMVQREFQRLYGPRYRARLITVDSFTEATRLLDEIRDGSPFEVLAAEYSTDISAAVGGLVPPISPRDETWPASIREVLPELLIGEASPVIPIDNQFAIIQLVEVIEPEPVAFEAVRPEVERELRISEERRLMDVLAREILDGADIIILDPDINEGWRRETMTP